jgi:hypothetical protein
MNSIQLLQHIGHAIRTYQTPQRLPRKPAAELSVGLDGKDKDKNLFGLHERKGDRLKVCRTLNVKTERPEEYTVEAGSKCVIEEWRREKKEHTVAEDRGIPALVTEM